MKTILCTVILFLAVESSKAQDFKSQIHVGHSDGYVLKKGSSLSKVLSSKFISNFAEEKVKSTSSSTFGMVEAGYKYQIKEKFKLGIDFAYQSYSATLLTEKTSRSIKQKCDFIVFLPNLSYNYGKAGLFELYGSVGVGARLTNEKLTEKAIQKSATDNRIDLAWHAIPIGFRREGKRIGGYCEAGFGVKGFVTGGVYYKI
ncbi:hypothetical protein [Flavobacterium poyangense]|uniref:hypothetical protein n=1 Tax=Flavobacterium poyangense TaxID=2204302 RepID=UPI00141FD9BD|nr:hypothetical protein [Flavobacterium sp. JXAS1]